MTAAPPSLAPASRERLALFATVRVRGEVVDETSVEAGRPLVVGPGGDVAIAAPEGAPYVVEATWTRPDAVLVADGGARLHPLGRDETLVVAVGPVEVELRLVPRFTLRRTSSLGVAGSLAWLAFVVASTLITLQADVVLRNRCAWFGIDCPTGAQGASGRTYDAEDVARMLRRDLSGEQALPAERSAPRRQEYVVKLAEDFYPAGGAQGDLRQMGGHERVAPEPVRGPDVEASRPKPRPQAEPEERVVEAAPVGAPVEVPVQPTEAPPVPDAVVEAPADPEAPESDAPAPTEAPAEEQQGWGLHDWLDASPEERAIQQVIDLARRRLAIDPDDPGALSMLAYHQYLAEDLAGAEATYDKLIALVPEDAAAYNNKALVLKRRGEWAREEALYRTALALDPGDTTALNNLAVNLAHQGRFDEALAIMRELEVTLPDDAYSDLHRAKIHAAMGNDTLALAFLEKGLQRMQSLDLLHHIEFRQDIRVDPAFDKLRADGRFRAILRRYYGNDAPI